MVQKYVCARKRLDWCREGKNDRQRSESFLRALGKSLRIRQVNAVLARSDGTVVDGWSRVLAARLEGLTELDVIITDEELTESDLVLIQWVSAEHRSGLTDGEKWRKACELMSMNLQWTPADLGAVLGLEPPSVTILLSGCKCCTAVQDALMAGQISLSVTYSISKAANEAEQMELLTQYLGGATRKDLDDARKERKSVNKPAKPVKRLKLEVDDLVLNLAGDFTLAMAGKAMVDLGNRALKAAKEGVEPKTFERLISDERSFKAKGETADVQTAGVDR